MSPTITSPPLTPIPNGWAPQVVGELRIELVDVGGNPADRRDRPAAH
jgi:hypothetical protein